MQEKCGRCSGLHFVIFLLEIEYLLSRILVNPTIGFLRTKKKVVLHIEDYTWAPVSGVFEKLHEVGVLSYLFYTLFKCFVMFELIEAVRGPFDRFQILEPKCGNFKDIFGQSGSVQGLIWLFVS